MYKLKLDGGSVFDFSVGGMYRDKKRDSFFNEYTFNSATGVKDPQYQGEDWNNYDEILFTPLKYGNISDPLNYDATEKDWCRVWNGEIHIPEMGIYCRVRVEHTNQGITL